MKILKLRLKNINSLKGEWSIDFANLAVNQGLFAIVGATGSGKSSILDAICVALYHRTPRIKVLSKTSNEVITKGELDMLSEVEFQVQNKVYLAFFSQKKSKKKGKLQDPVVQLAEADSGVILDCSNPPDKI